MALDWIEGIRRDNSSGAAALAARAALQLEAWSRRRRSQAERLQVARELVRAQPRMAPLVNLASRFLEAGPQPAQACREFLRRMKASAAKAATRAATLISDGDAVLTHSFSSTVLGALRRAAAQGKRVRVIVTESRPVNEGVALARELARVGIPARLIVDAAAASWVRESHLVLVGADAISPEGVVNKIGTAALALAARHSGVPVYAVATADKFVPSGYRLPPEPARDPHEVLAGDLPGVTVANYYFEVTPLELLTGVITEAGVRTADMLQQRWACPPVHPALGNL